MHPRLGIRKNWGTVVAALCASAAVSNAEAPAPGAGGAAADPEAIVHPSELLGVVELVRYPMALVVGKSLVDDFLHENPELKPKDPEADSVTRGRRIVGPIDVELANGFDTPEELAEKYLDAIFLEAMDLFDKIRVSEKEHAAIFWPEFPQSRPITNVTAGEAWFYHQGHCREGIMESIAKFGRVRLKLRKVRYDEGIAQYRNFNLYHGVVVEATTPDERIVELPWAATFAERNGEWKVYTYHD